MKKLTTKLLGLMLSLALVLTGCSSGTSNTESNSKDDEKGIKVGFIYTSSTGDGGWTYEHERGRLQVEEELGVTTIYKESVPESDEVEKVARDMIDQGCNIIFATSFGYMDYIEKVAKEFPEVKFFHCTGYKTLDNMSNYFGKIHDSLYLSGIVAGMKTTTNEIGFVAAFAIPEVIRNINAFTLGVRSVNPDAVVKVTWTNTWYDPAKEKEAALALIDQGVDVIAQHQNSGGPQQAAEEKGVFSVGYGSDMSNIAPKANMTSSLFNWGNYYVEAIKSVEDGTFKAESYWRGFDTGVIGLAPLTANAPDGAQAKVDEIQKKLADESFVIFSGAIKDNKGELRVKEGETLTDEQLLAMDWLVEGVVGEIQN